eukprot:6208957-Pleurochrysis_carterae.AAC.1
MRRDDVVRLSFIAPPLRGRCQVRTSLYHVWLDTKTHHTGGALMFLTLSAKAAMRENPFVH